MKVACEGERPRSGTGCYLAEPMGPRPRFIAVMPAELCLHLVGWFQLQSMKPVLHVPLGKTRAQLPYDRAVGREEPGFEPVERQSQVARSQGAHRSRAAPRLWGVRPGASTSRVWLPTRSRTSAIRQSSKFARETCVANATTCCTSGNRVGRRTYLDAERVPDGLGLEKTGQPIGAGVA